MNAVTAQLIEAEKKITNKNRVGGIRGTSMAPSGPPRDAIVSIGKTYLGKRACSYRCSLGERHFLAYADDVFRAAARERLLVAFTTGADEADIYAGAFCPIA